MYLLNFAENWCWKMPTVIVWPVLAQQRGFHGGNSAGLRPRPFSTRVHFVVFCEFPSSCCILLQYAPQKTMSISYRKKDTIKTRIFQEEIWQSLQIECCFLRHPFFLKSPPELFYSRCTHSMCFFLGKTRTRLILTEADPERGSP